MTLAGRYRVVRFIAEGGMGAVYEADDLELGARVALKLIRPELAGGTQARDRLKREVLLARRVSHPNVCRLFDLGRHFVPRSGAGGDDDGVEFITMELLAGESLVDLLVRRGPLHPAEALPLVRQMVAALGAAHRAGVVHRDFKSANVLLVPAPEARDREDFPHLRAVVTDFGLARSLEPLGGETDSSTATGLGTVVGTPAYVAPEQITGEEPTAAVDIYALGVVLFELVTGRQPFEGGDAAAVLLRRLREPAPDASELRPDLDPRWDDVIARCLEREPGRRFAAVEEVLRALDGQALEPRPLRAAGRWRLAAAVGTAIAALAVVGALALRRTDPGAAVAPWPQLATPAAVTAEGELDLFPSFSAEGGQLAYSRGRGGHFEMVLRDLASGADRVLAPGAEAAQPAISPNGQWVAYHSLAQGGVWLQPLEGGPARQLSRFGSRPAWAPDGEAVAFQSEPLVDLASNAVAAMPPSTIWVARLDGTPARPITAAGSPSGGHGAPTWSADGRHLFFVSADRRTSALWAVAADGSELVRLVDRHLYTYDPVASPDGRWLVYSAVGANGRFGLFALSLSADRPTPGEPQLLLDLDSRIPRQPTFSRDGRRLAYASLEMNSGLMAIDAEPGSRGGGVPRPLTAMLERHSRPAFSPDGAWLALERFRAGVHSDLWLLPASGGEPRRLTDVPAVDTVASWAPDGRSLIFRSDRLGRPTIWRLDLETLAATLAFDPHQEFDWARLSPDGQWLSMHSRQGSSAPNIWLAELATGEMRQVTFDSQQMAFACWSPDGELLGLEIKRGDDSHVGVLDLASGRVRQLTDRPGQAWPYSFSPDGRRIAFAGQRDGFWNIFWVDRVTGEERQLTSYARLDGYVRYPAWSPDGERVVFELAETRGNLWTVELLP